MQINDGDIHTGKPVPFKVYTHSNLNKIPQLRNFDKEHIFAMQVVATVLPFRVNQYVLDNLIDWNNISDDPMFQLTFPQQQMLEPEHFERIAGLIKSGADNIEIRSAVREIHLQLNPHPAEQRTLNVPRHKNLQLEGVQHKYRETVLFFPYQGQVCHSFCTFCFRWPQFVNDSELRIALTEGKRLRSYLRDQKEVTDLLVTGGDPLVMKTSILARHIEPILGSEFDHIQNIRIGTKALTYWPYRFTRDSDSADLLRLFERIVKSGKHLAIMAHFTHWRELEPDATVDAIREIQSTGAVIRSQSPVLRHLNDDPAVWVKLWRRQVQLGVVPYYMFVERDTGARRYFEIPLARTWEIYQKAIQQVSGLGRTARGPSMSAGPGKVEIQGVSVVNGEKCFVLRFIQGRNPDWVERPYFASYNPGATWLDQLNPAFGEDKFFYEDEYEEMRKKHTCGC
ncbi:MAG: lysine 2,3-aminomutase [Candidatus Dadabacteria bacterium]|nr:lysine 2,3-aminomutase [Candidatus Dadabacteria bacterium]NIS08466.1 lysine 2,3-aminomutase [Candidatus Dadabacteria bacterium]NIY21954.1 lysine 2,3-aminomutase [Candidatus Dadabacteria bacterium]